MKGIHVFMDPCHFDPTCLLTQSLVIKMYFTQVIQNIDSGDLFVSKNLPQNKGQQKSTCMNILDRNLQHMEII